MSSPSEINNNEIIIPKKIQETVSQRGFYFYEWIGSKDVKESIERDFLDFLWNYWLVGAIFLVVPTAIAYLASGGFPYLLFAILLWAINIIFLFYILFLSIQRSHILRKNNQILITDTSICIHWDILKLDNYKLSHSSEINKISLLFEEKLFNHSQISHSKNRLKQVVFNKFKDGYITVIEKSKGWWKDSGQLVLLLLALYTLYVFSVGIIYFIWIVVISLLWVIISWVNKKLLLISWHEISTISHAFENIDEYSKKLESEKNELIVLLEEAKNNNWKDSLLIKINGWIVVINNQASKAVGQSIDLKKLIEKSKYTQMFNFSIYNSWIKKQILTPLQEIRSLLSQNVAVLEKQIQDIDLQLSDKQNIPNSAALSMSKTRSTMRIEELKKHIKNMEKYIEKLK